MTIHAEIEAVLPDFPKYGMVFWFSMVQHSSSRVFIQMRVAAVAPFNPPRPFG